ncbi:MAG: MFS transporter [Clostridia bacterium]|nr:MFS transporter [Clostridia bacterium]MBR3594599.1 MFS transporter [Clostridia bacterium]
MKLNYKQTVLIGLSFMSILAFSQFYDQVIPFVLEARFNLSTFAANSIMAIDNVLAVFMLPLFGAISDRTNTRLGKRTPYILYGTIAAVILLIVLGIFETLRNFLGFFITLMLLLIAMAVYRTPSVAYMPDVTPKPLRSKANAVINLVGYLGGIFSTIVMMFLLKSEKGADGASTYADDQSFLPVFITVAVFMLVVVLIMVLSVRENRLPKIVDEPEENAPTEKRKLPRPVFRSLILILSSVFLWFMAYNAVTTAFSRYCVNVWGTDLGTSSSYLLVATVAAIISFVPLGFVSSALGRKKTILLGITLMTACYAIAILIRQQTPVMYAIFGLVGIGWAAINVNSFPMVVEMSSGSDVGKYTGFYYTFSMAAQIATPPLSGWLIDKLGFGYDVLFPYAVLFSALSFVTMCFVRHGDSKPEKRKSLIENFDTED